MRKVTFLLVMLFVAGMVSAQEVSTEAGRNTTFQKNGFWDNWFIGLGAGANIYFGDTDVDADIVDRVTVAPNFQVGTWLNPYTALRLKADGGAIHTFTQNAAVMSHSKYVAGEIDLMWDVTNYLLPYSPSRVYSFIPYIGAGYAYGWDYEGGYDNMSSPTINAGIINKFRFNDRLSLDIEVSGKLLSDNFEQRAYGRDYDALGSVSGSLVYNLGKNTFTPATLRDQAEIDQLNGTINAQRAEIEDLKKRPTEPKIVEVVKEVNVVAPGLEPANNVVLFSIGKSKIESHQEVNVYNVAKYLKDNKEAKLRIVGYTDNATGTVAINEKLSKERAQNVADLILNKYAVDSERVTIQWEGQTNPPFSVDEWNRAVILYIE